jgi:exonuclease III
VKIHFVSKEESSFTRIIFQNVQSFNNKIDILESFLEDHPYDVLCLSETWMKYPQAELVRIPGYELATAFCRSEHNGGGTCILLKNNIEYHVRQDINDISKEYFTECCCVELPSLSTILICIYRPDRDIEIFYNCLEILLEKIRCKERNKSIILGGDFNINMLHKSKHTQRLTDLMLSCNLEQLIKEPTRTTMHSSSCIDLVFTNNTSLETAVAEHGISDHKSVTCKLANPFYKIKKCPKPFTIYKRTHNQRTHIAFKQALTNLDWNRIIANDNSNDNYAAFALTLRNVLNVEIPLKRLVFKNNHKTLWLTKGLKKSCLHKRLLRVHAREAKGNPILKHHYKLYSKTLKKSVNLSKKLTYINIMKKSKNKTVTM